MLWVILTRLVNQAEHIFAEEQEDFRSETSTTEHHCSVDVRAGTLTADLKKRFHAFENKCNRRMLGVSCCKHKTNDDT